MNFHFGKHADVDDLRTVRRRCGYSQELLAEQVQLSQVSILNYETGRTIPRPATRAAIERELGESIDWIKTYFQRPVAPTHVEGEDPDEAMLRSIWAFINSAGGGPAKRARVNFIRNTIDYLADGM